MKKISLISFLFFLATVPCQAGGDVIILDDGTEVRGDILYTVDTDYVISVDGKPERYSITDISEIRFGRTLD